jgi:hypothetical protein
MAAWMAAAPTNAAGPAGRPVRFLKKDVDDESAICDKGGGQFRPHRKDSKMAKFTFRPAAKAFGETDVQKTIDVEISALTDRDEAGEVIGTVISASVNGRFLSTATIAHAVAFAIKQRLANSFVNAATAKNDDGGLLSVTDRLALWSSSLDKVLTKIVDPNAAPSWESVFAERGGESVDPIGAEVSKIVRARLVAAAKKQDKTLPKADSPEYAALKARLMEKHGPAIRAKAAEIVAARNAAIGDDDDFDLDDAALPGAEDNGDESEVDNVPEV